MYNFDEVELDRTVPGGHRRVHQGDHVLIVGQDVVDLVDLIDPLAASDSVHNGLTPPNGATVPVVPNDIRGEGRAKGIPITGVEGLEETCETTCVRMACGQPRLTAPGAGEEVDDRRRVVRKRPPLRDLAIGDMIDLGRPVVE